MSVDRDSGMVFESIIFRSGLLEVSFTEPHNRNNGIILMQTAVWDPPTKTPEEYEDFMISLVALVEAAQLSLRNPPDEIGG